MRIIVENVVSEGESGRPLVRFTSEAGAAWAVWSNGKVLPVVSQSYSVEFDLKQAARISTDALPTDKQASISSEAGDVLLTGSLEGTDDDDISYLRIAQDCLIMIETDESSCATGAPLSVRARVEDFEVFAV